LDGVEIRDRHVMLAFGDCVAFATIWQRITSGPTSGVAFGQPFSVPFGAAEALALVALFLVINRLKNNALLSRVDLLAIAAVSVAFALPSLAAASIPMAIVGMMFLARGDARLASIGQILLALVSYQFLGRLIFDLAAPFILPLETFAVTTLLSLVGDFGRDGADIIAPNGFTIFLEPPCSAFHNITVATLIWLALIKIERLEFLRSDWWALAAMVAATVTLNTIRIALMAQSEPMLRYWHDGQGVVVVSVVMLASLLGISFLSRVRPAAALA
jgi:exosortase/archaeosortase family protein